MPSSETIASPGLQSFSAEAPTFKTEQATSDYHDWARWKQSQSPEDLSTLLDTMEPIIHRATLSRRSSGIPEEALKTHARVLAVKAFKEYRPELGYQLNTHVTSQLQKLSRLVYNYQDLTHIPEHTQLKIGSYKQAKELLHEKLGRDATTEELVDELQWAPKDVERMERSLRKVLLSSKDVGVSSQITEMQDRDAEVFHLVYHDLRPIEKKVFEHITGYGGNEILKGDISLGGKLKMQPNEIRKIREAIAKKMKDYSQP